MTSQPIFLVGCVRSGTTLLRLMLDHHPKIAFLFEFEYAVEKIKGNSGWPDLKQYHEYLLSHRIFGSAKFEINQQLSYPELVDSFLRQKVAETGKSIVGATVHHHFDKITRVWPDAKFIHIYRDGRDVTRSCIQMGWAGNGWTGADRWIAAEELWKSMVPHIPEERRCEIRYKDLVRRPEEKLSSLCEFIGVAYDAAMMNYSEDSTYSAPDLSMIEQWRRKMSNAEVQLVEARIGDMLLERGYELSGLPRISVSPIMEKRLRWQDWSNRFRKRLQRYGALLVGADIATRRLGLNRWQKYVRQRVNQIDLQYLK